MVVNCIQKHSKRPTSYEVIWRDINTQHFSAHSTRGAATSKAKFVGVSTKDILKAANWSSSSTFTRFSLAEPHPASAQARGSGCKPMPSFVRLECNYHAGDYITCHEYRYLKCREIVNNIAHVYMKYGHTTRHARKHFSLLCCLWQ